MFGFLILIIDILKLCNFLYALNIFLNYIVKIFTILTVKIFYQIFLSGFV